MSRERQIEVSVQTKTDPVYLCEGCAAPNQPFYIGAIARHNICSLCRGMAVSLYDARVLDPWVPQGGDGLIPTTRVDVEVYRPWVWDVNGYYRALGVPTDASRLTIRRAYTAKSGPQDPRLTYIVKQLLNPGVRARYDACKPGELFFDRYLEESFDRRVAQNVAEHLELGEDLTSWEKVDLEHLRNNPVSVVDSAPSLGQTDRRRWRNYAWRTPHSQFLSCLIPLRVWQNYLIEAASTRQEVFRFAVGLAGDGLADPWRVEVLGGLPVIFLDDQTIPERSMAESVIDAITGNPHTPSSP